MRASISSSVVEKGDYIEMKAAAYTVINECIDYEKFIFGCGIVSYDTLPENVLKLKEIVGNYSE